jgi:Uma2 family endonuclease
MLLREPRIRRWTKKEYYEAGDLGWFDSQRVELIDGEVVEMAPQRDEHAHAVTLTNYAMRKAFGDLHVVRVQMPLDFGASQPEPDVAVIRGSVREVKSHPKTAALVIEVSDTTLAFDRGVKARLYASKGIRDYWIVNLVDRQVEVHRRPALDAESPTGRVYAEKLILHAGDRIAPLASRKVKVKIADLLP